MGKVSGLWPSKDNFSSNPMETTRLTTSGDFSTGPIKMFGQVLSKNYNVYEILISGASRKTKIRTSRRLDCRKIKREIMQKPHYYALGLSLNKEMLITSL